MAKVTPPQINMAMQVVHTTPGRVRVKACKQNIDIPTLKAIAQQLQEQESIYEVKLNYTTGSMVVSFDIRTMSLSQLWEILEDLNIDDRTPALTSTTTEALENKSPRSANTAVTLAADLIDALVPTIACMLVNQKLRTSGWRSLPVSVITSKLTRGIIAQLKAELDELTTKKNVTPTLAPSFQVVHSTPGRVRLRVQQVTKDADYAHRLEQLILTTDGVTNVRINRSAGSVAIAYQSHLDMLPFLANLLQEANLNATNFNTNKASVSPQLTTGSITEIKHN